MRLIIIGGSLFVMLVLFALIWMSERGRRNLEKSEARLEAILNTVSDGIVVINNRGFIESVNPM